MYKAELIINNKKFKGTLDFEVLKNTLAELKKLGKNFTFLAFFKAIKENNMEVISALVIKSIAKLGEYTEDQIAITYINSENTLDKELENFNNILTYLNELFEECMPKGKSKSNSIFDDEEEFEDIEDWNLAEFEYVWESDMGRSNFWDITPKNFYEQLEVLEKRNKKDNSTEF